MSYITRPSWQVPRKQPSIQARSFNLHPSGPISGVLVANNSAAEFSAITKPPSLRPKYRSQISSSTICAHHPQFGRPSSSLKSIKAPFSIPNVKGRGSPQLLQTFNTNSSLREVSSRVAVKIVDLYSRPKASTRRSSHSRQGSLQQSVFL